MHLLAHHKCARLVHTHAAKPRKRKTTNGRHMQAARTTTAADVSTLATPPLSRSQSFPSRASTSSLSLSFSASTLYTQAVGIVLQLTSARGGRCGSRRSAPRPNRAAHTYRRVWWWAWRASSGSAERHPPPLGCTYGCSRRPRLCLCLRRKGLPHAFCVLCKHRPQEPFPQEHPLPAAARARSSGVRSHRALWRRWPRIPLLPVVTQHAQ
jgi:hypothetical protein